MLCPCHFSEEDGWKKIMISALGEGEAVEGGKQKNRKCTNAENICLKKYVIAYHSIMDPDAQENQHLFVVKCG